MCLKIFSYIFVILAFLLTIQLISVTFGITKKMKSMQASDYVSSIACVLLLYIINALVLLILIPGIYSKILMLSFALIPFIIGETASYKKLQFYSFLQIICVIISGVYVLVM